MYGGALAHPAERFPSVFGLTFFKTYPYFLPCAVSAGFAAFAWFLTVFCLKETVAAPVSVARLILRWKRNPATLVMQNVVEGQDFMVACDGCPSNSCKCGPDSRRSSIVPDSRRSSLVPDSRRSSVADLSKEMTDNKPWPLRALFTKDVMIAGGNYALLSLVDIGYRAIQPLFYSTPRELGGLGLAPSEIGSVSPIIS
jgi:hypothetical protein